MLARSLLPFAVILALAACGEEQTAEAPATPTPPTSTETAQAPPASTPAAPPASTSSTTAAGTDSSAAPSGTTGETTGTTTAPPADSTQTAATSAASLEPFQGKTYAAGPMTIQLNPDNTFVMNEADGSHKVEGRYAFQDGVVTFSDPQGDVGEAQFPMRCRFEASGTSEFRLSDVDGACTRFKDLTFKPAAG